MLSHWGTSHSLAALQPIHAGNPLQHDFKKNPTYTEERVVVREIQILRHIGTGVLSFSVSLGEWGSAVPIGC